jgi:hypothetical protein
MSDEVENRDDSWGKECPDRYEIILYFSNGIEYDVPKYVKQIICTYAELNKRTLRDYIWSKPIELQRLLYNQTLDDLVDISLKDRTDYMEKTLQRFVDRSVNKYLGKNNKTLAKSQMKLPESEGHIRVKNAVVEYLRSLEVEAYPEVVFYDGKVSSDFYEWQRNEKRLNPDADGIFGYGSVGFGNYKPEYGTQIKSDVGGWISDSFNFKCPVVSVEVMKSSNLREEVINLNKIHGVYSVFTVIVDAFGEIAGAVNNTPVVSLEGFKKGIPKRIELVRKAINAGKSENEIFEIGRKFNVGKIE